MDVGPLMPQKGHGLDAVPGHAQMYGHVGLAEGFLHQPDITVLLRNERYRGVVVWAKTRKIRNAQNGRRIQRGRPQSEWVRVEMPEQRIVPEKLWLAVQKRLAYVNRVFVSQGRKGEQTTPAKKSGMVETGKSVQSRLKRLLRWEPYHDPRSQSPASVVFSSAEP